MVDYLTKILKDSKWAPSKDQLLKATHPARGLTDGQSPGHNRGCHTRNFPMGYETYKVFTSAKLSEFKPAIATLPSAPSAQNYKVRRGKDPSGMRSVSWRRWLYAQEHRQGIIHG